MTTKKNTMTDAYNAWKNASTDPGNTLRDNYYAKLKDYEQADYDLIKLKAQLVAPSVTIPSPDDYFTKYQNSLEDSGLLMKLPQHMTV